MPIVVTCTCGKELKAKAESAGKKSKCPFCGAEVMIPQPVVAETGAGGGAAVFATHEATSAFDWGLLDPDPKPEAADKPGEGPKSGAAIPSAPKSGAAIPTAGKTEAPKPTIVQEATAAPLAKAAEVSEKDKRYKVLSQKDMGFAVKFDSKKVEEALNAQAMEGWLLKMAFTMPMPTHSGTQQELVVILERKPGNA